MNNDFARRPRRLATALFLPVLALLAGCDDNPVQGGGVAGYNLVVLNSVERSLTVTHLDDAAAPVLTIGLGAQGSPVNFATRGDAVVVPMGIYPFAAVVSVLGRQVTYMVPLPSNSGATGAAFLNDSIAVVANAGRNTVTPVNVRRGTAGAEVAVGTYPQYVVAEEDGDFVYVINGNLVSFTPAGPGSVTVLDRQLQVVGTIPLSGINSGAAAVDGNRLFVLNAGTFGGNNGTLSVVDLTSRDEERHVTGFGEFPGSLAVAPNGDVHVGVYGTGIVVWDPDTRTFVRPLQNPIVPGGSPPVAGLAFDPRGRLHSVNPGNCDAAGLAYRLDASGAVQRTVTTGICPFFTGFTEIPGD